MKAVTARGGNLQVDFMQHFMIAVGESHIADIDLGHAARSNAWRRTGSAVGDDAVGSGFRHIDQVYHDKRLLLRSRKTIEVSAISMTRTRKTNAAPYCTRSVYSFCGIFELTT